MFANYKDKSSQIYNQYFRLCEQLNNSVNIKVNDKLHNETFLIDHLTLKYTNLLGMKIITWRVVYIFLRICGLFIVGMYVCLVYGELIHKNKFEEKKNIKTYVDYHPMV